MEVESVVDDIGRRNPVDCVKILLWLVDILLQLWLKLKLLVELIELLRLEATTLLLLLLL